jgi:hypothetical protein
MRGAVLVFAIILAFAVCRADPEKLVPIAKPLATLAPRPIQQSPPMHSAVPKEILEAALNKAAGLANVAPEQPVVVRAESVVWNDGSLGCPEPGMMYTQALVNGYWVVIKAGNQTYDFRVDSRGSLLLCPKGRGHPPLTSDAS